MNARGATVLAIDDEPQIHRFLRPALEAAGFAFERAETAAEGLRLAASRAPDAVLLDLGLPDMDGQEVLRRLRAFSEVPVLVLSARDREREKVLALDGGADDYLVKPFGVAELLARIRASLRHARRREGVGETVAIAGHEIDLSRRELRRGDGGSVALSPREWSLLETLARHAGRVLTHRQLLSAVWGDAHVDDLQYLRVYVGQLRHKLGASGGRSIRTEAGIGYRLLPAEDESQAGRT